MKAKRTHKKKSSPQDIAELILRDHKELKKMLKSLKSERVDLERKKEIFPEFASLLKAHSEPEEQALYTRMKKVEKLRCQGFEGDTEHHIADRLAQEIEGVSDDDEWEGKAKVLAELVEHHVQEEEEEMLKDVKKQFSTEERVEIGEEYLRLRGEFMGEAEAA